MDFDILYHFGIGDISALKWRIALFAESIQCCAIRAERSRGGNPSEFTSSATQ